MPLADFGKGGKSKDGKVHDFLGKGGKDGKDGKDYFVTGRVLAKGKAANDDFGKGGKDYFVAKKRGPEGKGMRDLQALQLPPDDSDIDARHAPVVASTPTGRRPTTGFTESPQLLIISPQRNPIRSPAHDLPHTVPESPFAFPMQSMGQLMHVTPHPVQMHSAMPTADYMPMQMPVPMQMPMQMPMQIMPMQMQMRMMTQNGYPMTKKVSGPARTDGGTPPAMAPMAKDAASASPQRKVPKYARTLLLT